MERDRPFQSWLRQLRPRVDEWRASPGDEGTLLRGGPRAVAEDWLVRRGGEVNEEEKAFVAASVALRDPEKRRQTNPSRNLNRLLSSFTVDPGDRSKSIEEMLICCAPAETQEPEPECDPADASPWEEDWREATLKRLEAWIEEREKLIAEIERRIEEEATVT